MGNSAAQRKTLEEKWAGNKKNPVMWLGGNASLFFGDVSWGLKGKTGTSVI